MAPAIGGSRPWFCVKIAEVDGAAPRSIVDLDTLSAVGKRTTIGEGAGHWQPGTMNGREGDQVPHDQHPGARSKRGHRAPGKIKLHPVTEPHVVEIERDRIADIDQLDELRLLHEGVIHDFRNREIELHVAWDGIKHRLSNVALSIVNKCQSLAEVREMTRIVAEYDP